MRRIWRSLSPPNSHQTPTSQASKKIKFTVKSADQTFGIGRTARYNKSLLPRHPSRDQAQPWPLQDGRLTPTFSPRSTLHRSGVDVEACTACHRGQYCGCGRLFLTEGIGKDFPDAANRPPTRRRFQAGKDEGSTHTTGETGCAGWLRLNKAGLMTSPQGREGFEVSLLACGGCMSV